MCYKLHVPNNLGLLCDAGSQLLIVTFNIFTHTTPQVELHVHLDGALRIQTIIDLAKYGPCCLKK